jgi:membrane-associated phospholipid phosphatase
VELVKGAWDEERDAMAVARSVRDGCPGPDADCIIRRFRSKRRILAGRRRFSAGCRIGRATAGACGRRPFAGLFSNLAADARKLGSGFLQVGGAVATYAIGRAAGHERTAQVGSDLIRAQVLNTVVTQGIQVSVRRIRPDGSSFSFPSGHASGTFASAAVLHRHFGWRVGVPSYAVAAYVATSRVQERRHFLSDVVVGAAIGIAAGRSVTIGRRGRVAIVPMLSRRGAGVTLVRVSSHAGGF